MGIAAIKIKIMPESPEVDLEKIKDKVKNIIQNKEGINPNFEEKPIAFGLKAINVTFAWPEEEELEKLEKRLEQIENVKSIEVVDIRRAVG